MNRRDFLKRFMIYGAGSAVAGYAYALEPVLVHTNTYSIFVPNLPPAFESFTIVHLTDIHYGNLVSKAYIESVIEKANRIPKDIIVCTGDHVQGGKDRKEIDSAYELLGRLHAPLGVYSVLGNHDHWANFKRCLNWLDRLGQNLRHRSVRIEKNGGVIYLGGAGDLMEDRIGIDEAFQTVPEDACKILIAHNPDTADRNFKTSVDLMLCGHTHGGQVNIPFFGPPILPIQNKKYVRGFIRTPKTGLFVSRGIGVTGLPIRFNCPPEIAVLKLTSDPNTPTT